MRCGTLCFHFSIDPTNCPVWTQSTIINYKLLLVNCLKRLLVFVYFRKYFFFLQSKYMYLNVFAYVWCFQTPCFHTYIDQPTLTLHVFTKQKMNSICFIYFISVCYLFVCLFMTSEDIWSRCSGQYEDLAWSPIV